VTQEADFLARYDADEFWHPSVAVDVALVTVTRGKLRVLLLRRPDFPHRGRWQLPGKFVQKDELLKETVAKALEKAGLSDVFTEQLYTFDEIHRDPRDRVLSVSYYGLVDAGVAKVGGTTDLIWAEIDGATADRPGDPFALVNPDGTPIEIAFDHLEIVAAAVQRLRGKLDYSPVGYELLPAEFTLRDLETIHEVILGAPHNKDSFRRRMLASGDLEAVGRRETGVGHRPAALYRFASQREGSGQA
jgi:8-oxo-dGTP diphosphatase